MYTENQTNEDYLKWTQQKGYIGINRVRFIIEEVRNYCVANNIIAPRILDAGCGVGNISFPLGSLGFEVYALDVDPKSISYCQNRNVFPNVRFMVGNVENPDNIQEQFDIIICAEVLEHLPHPDAAFINFARLLKRNGILLLSIPNGYGPGQLVERLQGMVAGILRKLHLYRMVKPIYSFLLRESENTDYRTSVGFLDAESIHVQFFTLGTLKKEAAKYGFGLLLIKHGYFLGVYELLRRNRVFGHVDYALANILPHWAVSGWSLKFVKTDKQN